MKRPYITLKFAQTLDGKIAARDGSSQWISAPPALKFTHGLRARNRAILIGVGTVLRDNPSLTTRLVKGRAPLVLSSTPAFERRSARALPKTRGKQKRLS